MKKLYICPVLDVMEVDDTDICTGSVDQDRSISGTPAEDGVAPPVTDASEFDPNNGHGQGEGGTGSRAKGGGYTAWGISWDDDEF